MKSVPALSPTGFRIAYDRGVENSTADAEDIYVLDLRSGRRYRLTHNPNDEETPAWSPDGSKILFVRGAWSPRAELYVMDSDGTDVVRLTYNRVAERDPAWSPDGSSIAFTVGQYTGDDLFVMAADGSSRRRLTKTPATEASPAWSPSGREIAFTRIGNGAHIISLNLVTGEETQLTRGRHGNNLSPSYSPDGARIVYSCGRRYSARNICVMRSDGAEHHRVLTSRGSVYCCPDWGGNRFGDGPLAWKVRREVVRSLRAMKVFGIARRALAALHP